MNFNRKSRRQFRRYIPSGSANITPASVNFNIELAALGFTTTRISDGLVIYWTWNADAGYYVGSDVVSCIINVSGTWTAYIGNHDLLSLSWEILGHETIWDEEIFTLSGSPPTSNSWLTNGWIVQTTTETGKANVYPNTLDVASALLDPTESGKANTNLNTLNVSSALLAPTELGKSNVNPATQNISSTLLSPIESGKANNSPDTQNITSTLLPPIELGKANVSPPIQNINSDVLPPTESGKSDVITSVLDVISSLLPPTDTGSANVYSPTLEIASSLLPSTDTGSANVYPFVLNIISELLKPTVTGEGPIVVTPDVVELISALLQPTVTGGSGTSVVVRPNVLEMFGRLLTPKIKVIKKRPGYYPDPYTLGVTYAIVPNFEETKYIEVKLKINGVNYSKIYYREYPRRITTTISDVKLEASAVNNIKVILENINTRDFYEKPRVTLNKVVLGK